MNNHTATVELGLRPLAQAQAALHDYETRRRDDTTDTATCVCVTPMALLEAQAYAAVAQAQAMTRIAECLEQRLEDETLRMGVPAKYQWAHGG